MDEKYRMSKKIQFISCICYVISSFILLVLSRSYTNLLENNIEISSIIMAVIAIISLMVTSASGIYKGIISSGMGIKSSKKDWLLLSIACLLAAWYLMVKLFK